MTPERLASLCDRALPAEGLTAEELAELCFGPGDVVIGDDLGAAVLRTAAFDGLVACWLVLVAVDPDHQGRGRGKALVAEVAARARAAGATEVQLAAAVPRYVWPGVDLHATQAAAFFEGVGFGEGALAIDMEIPTRFRCPPPEGVTVARDREGAALDVCRGAFPHWEEEVSRAVAKGTAFVALDPHGHAIGFSCHSVNRRARIGPMATDPAVGRRGIGSATLAAVCADLEARGVATGEIAWVSNLRFYGKCGATVGRVFRGGRLPL